MAKLIRITTIPLSLEKLLEGQLTFMADHYDVTAVSAEKERLAKYGADNKINTFHVEMTREITPFADALSLIKLFIFFKNERPLIVHTHTPKAGILGMLAAKMARVPLRLHTVAGMPLMETTGAKREILEAVEKLTYFCATRVYPNSKGLHDIILEKKFAPPGKLKVLGKGSSNGIDTSYFDPTTFSSKEKSSHKEQLGIPETDLVFIFVGRLVADKGINELVEAFVRLEAQNQNVSLLLVGPFEQELNPIKESNFNRIRTHPKIFSVGYQNDVRPFFSISDLLVFPSYREGFPNVVMQAGAMGLPSIVTNINGCNEIIANGVNGVIIPVKNQFALYDAMEKLLKDPFRCNTLQQNARKKITDNFERKTFWQILLNEYRLLEESL